MAMCSKDMRDSISDPLRISELSVPGMPGLIGMTICPGKKGPSTYGRPWNRDLDADMALIHKEWQANVMVTLLEEHEFSMLGVESLPEYASKTGALWPWIHLQIADGEFPDERFETEWPIVRTQLIGSLASGGRVLIHCRGGLGRTGLVAALLLVETGMTADNAISLVRAIRPGAIETEAQEQYVRRAVPALPISLRQGLTIPLCEVLAAENIALDSPRAQELGLNVFAMIQSRWYGYPCSIRDPRLQAKFLGVDESGGASNWYPLKASLPQDFIKRIDLLSRICVALPKISGNDILQEMLWLDRSHAENDPLQQLLNGQSPLEYIRENGIPGLEAVSNYLEEKVACVIGNERFLLCLGVCNTLFDTPYVKADMVLALALQGVKNPQECWQANIMAARDLPNAIPLGNHHVLLPRPYLKELIEYIQQHPNLDVAIISGATREYIDKYLGMVAPELLEMCQFIWSREDNACYFKRGAGTTIKTLEHIPELKGYRPDRIYMVEHNAVYPYDSHLRVAPFYGDSFNVDTLQNEHGLKDVIQRLSILTKIDHFDSIDKDP